MNGKITENGYRIIDHGKGCLEIEDRGFSVLINPSDDCSSVSSANIVFDFKGILTGDEVFISGERFCGVAPSGLDYSLDGFDFEVVDDGSTVDIFGVKLSFDSLSEGGFRLVIEMADMNFCYLLSENEVKKRFIGSDRVVDFLLVPLGEGGMSIKDAVKSSVAVKPSIVAAYSLNSVEDSKVRSFKAEIEDRNIDMYSF